MDGLNDMDCFNGKFIVDEPVFTAEEAKANVRSYQEQQSNRNYVEEELNKMLHVIEQVSTQGLSSYTFVITETWIDCDKIKERLEQLGFTVHMHQYSTVNVKSVWYPPIFKEIHNKVLVVEWE